MKHAQWIALGSAVLALVAGARALRWGIDKGDPRRSLVRQIRADADPMRDMLIVTDEAPELVAAAAPLPAVWGTPPIHDLGNFRRLYVVANGDGPLAFFEARLGRPTHQFATSAVRWDLDGLRTVRFDIVQHFLDRVTARREGGRVDGPCPRQGNALHCNSPDGWNHLQAEDRVVGGGNVRCLFAHPQENSRLVLETGEIDRARFLVGMVAIDDRSFFPAGAAVVNHVTFTPTDGAALIEQDVVAPNRTGPTPYRLALGGHPGRARFSITTANAGARAYCFTALATD